MMVLVATSFAQIPNGSFENWTDGNLDGWWTALEGKVKGAAGIPIALPVKSVLATQTDVAHSGSSAVLLKGNKMAIEGIELAYRLPGALQLGSLENMTLAFKDIQKLFEGQATTEEMFTLLEPIMASGIPCEKTPTQLKLWYKYLPLGKDTMSVTAFTKKDGKYVSLARFYTGDVVSEYTQLKLNFDKALEPCDTLCVIILSGAFKNHESTELYIDDIEISYDRDGIEDHEAGQLCKVWPNPASNQLNILLNDVQKDAKYQMFDLTGRCVVSGQCAAERTTVDVRSLVSGLYLLKVEQNGKVDTQKIVIQ